MSAQGQYNLLESTINNAAVNTGIQSFVGTLIALLVLVILETGVQKSEMPSS